MSFRFQIEVFSVHKLSTAGHLPRKITGRGKDEICGLLNILERSKYSVSLSLYVHRQFTYSYNSLSGLSQRTKRKDHEKVIKLFKVEDELLFQILRNTYEITYSAFKARNIETLPKAQRTRGLSSYHKFLHKSSKGKMFISKSVTWEY